jgi:putative transposase
MAKFSHKMAIMTQPEEYRKKLKHFDVPGEAHFLTFSCYHRLALLSKDRTRRWFLEALGEARDRQSFDLWAWVLMPEHVHLLVNPRLPVYSVSRILHAIKKPVATRAIRYLELHAPHYLPRLTVVNRQRVYRRFWQAGAGYDENHTQPAAIHRLIAYIHENPVRRRLVMLAEKWAWSSAADWAGSAEVPIKVDRTVPVVLETGK